MNILGIILITILSPIILFIGISILFGIVTLFCIFIDWLGNVIDKIMEVFNLWKRIGQDKVQNIT